MGGQPQGAETVCNEEICLPRQDPPTCECLLNTLAIDPLDCRCLRVTPNAQCDFDFFTLQTPLPPCNDTAFIGETCLVTPVFDFLDNCANVNNTSPVSFNVSACQAPFTVCFSNAVVVNQSSLVLLGLNSSCFECLIPFSWKCCEKENQGTGTGNTGTGTGNTGGGGDDDCRCIDDDDDDDDGNGETLEGASPNGGDSTWVLVVLTIVGVCLCMCCYGFVLLGYAENRRGDQRNSQSAVHQPLLTNVMVSDHEAQVPVFNGTHPTRRKY